MMEKLIDKTNSEPSFRGTWEVDEVCLTVRMFIHCVNVCVSLRVEAKVECVCPFPSWETEVSCVCQQLNRPVDWLNTFTCARNIYAFTHQQLQL